MLKEQGGFGLGDQPFFVMEFFEIGSRGTICWSWLQTTILLISAS
jgi:hypothetical protein